MPPVLSCVPVPNVESLVDVFSIALHPPAPPWRILASQGEARVSGYQPLPQEEITTEAEACVDCDKEQKKITGWERG